MTLKRSATKRGTLSGFLLEAGSCAARDARLDRTLFNVGPRDYARFVERLDAPPKPNERLRRMMTTKAPWD
jgi:uncharacterized protein (DUF1778 family)